MGDERLIVNQVFSRCPFCGETNCRKEGKGPHRWVECVHCGACGPVVMADEDPMVEWNDRTTAAADSLEKMIARLGDSFRGLWASYTLPLPAGEFKTKREWTVTFIYRGEYCETQLVSTPERALEIALERHEEDTG